MLFSWAPVSVQETFLYFLPLHVNVNLLLTNRLDLVITLSLSVHLSAVFCLALSLSNPRYLDNIWLKEIKIQINFNPLHISALNFSVF